LGGGKQFNEAMIHNPIIPGFHPDPSICRAGDDFYIANSTFEWFPGVPIHHSRDLANWRLLGHALTRTSLLDLRGVADSGGVWAPSLSFSEGQFWLIYTNVRTCGMGRPFKDVKIFLITAPDILGPWSEPVELNSIGFDPSLFHDEDGRKWLVNMMWDFRKGRSRFAGIVLQEYDPQRRKLIGSMTKILEKPNVLCEGPNLYQHNGWYHLMLAEGGTGWNHGISMARSRTITGPYELDPQAALLTSRDEPALPLQKAGHGELVQTPAGEWYLVHLASRPLTAGGEINSGSPDQTAAAAVHAGQRCILGRETCLQKVEWSPAGWLRLATGGAQPRVEVPLPQNLTLHPWPTPPERDDFDTGSLDVQWSSLRVPADSSWLSLTERRGWLRLCGRDSLFSWFTQSLIARRVRHFEFTAETCLEFAPGHFTQMAGLICYYETRQFYYLRVTHEETRGRVLGVVQADAGQYDELGGDWVINDWAKIFLRVEVNREQLQFSASADGQSWRTMGPVLDATKLSDDYGGTLRFTGAMVGLCAQDVGGTMTAADFDYFTYHGRTSQS
jgi:xylan 1,4-beta-xylosidase